MRVGVDTVCDLAQLQALAARIAALVQEGDVVTLRGEVGAGKTTFARAFIQSVGGADTEIASPTFTLMQSYNVRLAGGRPAVLWHLDLYRLKEANELRALGLEELEKSIMLIEWPEIMEAQLPEHRLDILMEFAESDDVRRVRLGGGEVWRGRLHRMVKGLA